MKLRKINDSDIVFLKDYFKSIQPEFSSYNLASIYLWDMCFSEILIGEINNYIIIAENSLQNLEKKAIYFPLRKNKLPTPKELCEILNIVSYKMIYYVPYDYIESNPDIEIYFEIYEQTNQHDYLYSVESLAYLKGSKYSAKRNLIKQFEKNYDSLFELKDFSMESISDIISLWYKTKSQISEETALEILDCEKRALENIKKYVDKIEMFGKCLYTNGKIKAFAIGSYLNDKTCVLNFEKADKEIKGLYQFIDREFAKSLINKYLYINKESDLGKENLRKAKISYHPIKIIKSYMLKLK
ncbi:MAG: phosphatidylglycerol lysyltransferase domain-containing protein [Elusimicrobiales bacterium]|nr:phosphatidylglycerol lysyltransferase domain-containing protein [Elusimicrobiales bacterium]